MATAPASGTMLTVTALTALIKSTLSEAFPALWVKGELSGVKHVGSSGHLYFSLKDGNALIECVMWKTRNSRLSFEPKDGMEVEAFGSITVYESRGRYQLMADELRPAGLGALLLALEQLKRRLQAEGLFDASRKRALPRYPRRIGIVTSPVGAAVRDVVKVLRARWPGIGLVLAPVRVQGPGAAEEVAAAIERFNRLAGVDLLIVGRGGGSLEDLWAFNEERVVRAIAASTIPIISAVGHEVDTTLADFVADVRAATPSHAAEMAVRVRAEVGEGVKQLDVRLARALRQGMAERQRRLATLIDKYGFRRQRDLLVHLQQGIDELVERARQSMRTRLQAARLRLSTTTSRYGLRSWRHALDARRQGVAADHHRLEAVMVDFILARKTLAGSFADRMRALSPRLVLERGYCLARRPDGTLMRSTDELRVGDLLQLEFARGEADARIEALRQGDRHGA
jgi:exodeoxyribonuclease VII large subunit